MFVDMARSLPKSEAPERLFTLVDCQGQKFKLFEVFVTYEGKKLYQHWSQVSSYTAFFHG
jgi:hypothetical protein